ncbi:thiolase family protein [Nanoarchaeota archaeon]
MYVKGVGQTRYGITDKFLWQLGHEAVGKALADADMTMKDIDAMVITNLDFATNGERQRHSASLFSSVLKTNIPIIRQPSACASGGSAIWTANQLDEFDNVLVLGAEKLLSMSSQTITTEFMMGAESRWEQDEGLIFPTQNALAAQQYMIRYGVTTDDLALIAHKNHQNAKLNPKARFYGKDVSLDAIKSSNVVTSPFRLMDCSVSVDGAAAIVLSNDKTDVELIGSSLFTDYLPSFERSMTWFDATRMAAATAYRQAGLTPKDIDFAEVHDAFTMLELISYEDLGFAKIGQGVELVRDGSTKIDGRLPVNASGGLKAKGHPVAATGVGQVVEVVNQLRGKCGDRQINNPKIGLAQNIGGAGGTIIVNILKKVMGG